MCPRDRLPPRPPPPFRPEKWRLNPEADFAGGVGAPVVRRHDLDVERLVASVDVVLDAHVRELDVPLVVTRQVVLVRPGLDLQQAAVRPSVAVIAVAVRLLQELTGTRP